MASFGGEKATISTEAAHQKMKTKMNSVAAVQPISNSRETTLGISPRLAGEPRRNRIAKVRTSPTTSRTMAEEISRRPTKIVSTFAA